MKKLIPILTFIVFTLNSLNAQEQLDNFALKIGVMARGELNAITDVKGVKVGHTTLIKGDSVRTGVTGILPHAGNIFQEKVI
jgi:D-aminopeptidase